MYLCVTWQKSLERPYTGPYKVLKRPSDRVFDIEVNGASRSVSIELLKPASIISDILPELSTGGELNSNQPTTVDRPVLKTYARKKVSFALGTKA